MSFTNIKSKIQSERGFTIVELLIVVVVIAILAAITIVSYNGITRSANASSAKSTAGSVAKKLEAYQAEQGRYPLSLTELSADSSKSYYLNTGILNTSGAFIFTGLTAANGANTVIVRKCGSSLTGSSTQADVTATNIVGMTVSIWAFDGTPVTTGNQPPQNTLGQTTGTGIYCPAS